MDFRPVYQIPTPEQVPVNVVLGGIANRVFAFMIDFGMMAIVMGVVFSVGLMITGLDADLGRSVVPIAMFLVFFGFFMLQEWLWNGRTVGKYLLNLRVVKGNGQPIGFWEAFGRNLFRVVDVYFSGIGLLVMLISAQEKRFGDYVAGTVVVSEEAPTKPLLRTKPANNEEVPVWIRQMQPQEYELLNDFLSRRKTLLPQAAQQMESALARYFRERLETLPDEASQTSDTEFLQTLCEAYREATFQNNI